MAAFADLENFDPTLWKRFDGAACDTSLILFRGALLLQEKAGSFPAGMEINFQPLEEARREQETEGSKGLETAKGVQQASD